MTMPLCVFANHRQSLSIKTLKKFNFHSLFVTELKFMVIILLPIRCNVINSDHKFFLYRMISSAISKEHMLLAIKNSCYCENAEFNNAYWTLESPTIYVASNSRALLKYVV